MVEHNMSPRHSTVWSGGGWTRNQLGNTRDELVHISLENPWSCLAFVLAPQSCEVVLFDVFQTPNGPWWMLLVSYKTRLSVPESWLTLPRMRMAFFRVKNWGCKQLWSGCKQLWLLQITAELLRITIQFETIISNYYGLLHKTISLLQITAVYYDRNTPEYFLLLTNTTFITSSLLPIIFPLLRITSDPLLHITSLGVSNTTNYLRNVICSNETITTYYVPGQLGDGVVLLSLLEVGILGAYPLKKRVGG